MAQVYTKPASLPHDFKAFLKAFLHEIPAGEMFSLWNIQSALRSSRPGVPAAMSFEPELRTACELGLAWELVEDISETAKHQAESGRDLRFGRTFVRLCTGQTNRVQ